MRQKIVLKILSPMEVCEGQIKMKIKREEERKEKEKDEKAREKKKGEKKKEKSKSDREKKKGKREEKREEKIKKKRGKDKEEERSFVLRIMRQAMKEFGNDIHHFSHSKTHHVCYRWETCWKEVKRDTKEVDQVMASSSLNLEDLSHKTHMKMKYMKKLEAKLDKLEGGLESMRIDSHSVNAKIHSWDSLKGYILIWWNKISLQCRGLRRASIDSWEELKKEM
ncbi:hypothetical protein CR513_13761, partial [Mucuna pruriens]